MTAHNLSVQHRLFVGALAATILVGGCGGERQALLARGTVADLQYRIATSPADRDAHIRLGVLQLRAGNKGAALRALEHAHELDPLGGPVKRQLAGLLLERAQLRVQRRLPGATGDLARARRLDPELSVAKTLQVAAQAQAALRLLRHADVDRRRAGEKAVARLRRLEPAHPLVAVVNPRGVSTRELGVAIDWLSQRDAGRLVVDLGRVYWERGGRDGAVMRRYLRAHSWWYGRGRRPSLLMMNELSRRGVRICEVAIEPAEYGCGLELDRLAASADRSARLLARARQLFWSVSEPTQAAAWTVIALRGWLSGRGEPWLDELSRRVDVTRAIAKSRNVPLYARATLLRAAQDARASAALAAALAAEPSFTRTQRAVVLAEAAFQTRTQAVATIIDRGDLDELGWRVALRSAHALRIRPTGLSKAPAALVREHAAAVGRLTRATTVAGASRHLAMVRLSRWWHTLDGAPGVRDGVVEDWKRSGDATDAPLVRAPAITEVDLLSSPETKALVALGLTRELSALAAAYRRAPAAAERLATELVDRSVEPSRLIAGVAALFGELGAWKRALRWREKLVGDHASVDQLVKAGVAAARAGRPRLAQLRLLAAAAWAGDRARVHLEGARAFLAARRPVEALDQARAALHHTAPGEEQLVLSLIVEASLAAGRQQGAIAAAERWIERTPRQFQRAAQARMRAWWPTLGSNLASSRWFGAGSRVAGASKPAHRRPKPDTSRLERARRWNPDDPRHAVALLELARPRDGRYEQLLGEMLAATLLQWERGRTVSDATMRVLIGGFEAVGASAVARALERASKRVQSSVSALSGLPPAVSRRP